ncbi:MAG: ATP-binding cassette domain-containing protein [Gammaproteobacteria bacterium]|nr:ATP-binding cassette domain-containing protein [Gammaproteobacteria bacterium]
MSLLTLRAVNVSFGGPAILQSIDLRIEPRERICLVGRNGEGKSTLMKVLLADLAVDGGEVVTRQGLKIAQLEQDVPDSLNGSVFDVVARGDEQGQLLVEYYALNEVREHDDTDLRRMEYLYQEIDTHNGWLVQQRIDTVLSKLQLSPEDQFSALSGGQKRRVLLARALVVEPDLLLLDEPTNHLDMASITWLEEFLLSYRGTVLFITHDRTLLKKLATRIIELDRGHLTSWPGNYDAYLQGKEALLDAEKKQNANFDKKLAQEEVWVRQGIKARRTRNEGRVRALQKMRRERQGRRERSRQANIQTQKGNESGKIVIEAKNVSYAYDDQIIIDSFSTVILRGDKVGLIGPNGAGKSTLLKIFLDQLVPQKGSIRLGTHIEVAFFDQHRAQLNKEQSVLDNVSGGRDFITVNGQSKHIIGYLQDFLFSPDRARTPVKALSGGERNRLLLAKLFTKPANLLVMDEPTNDLDVETLELLEQLLVDYNGTVLLVSHDRSFLNNVVTSSLVFEGSEGQVNEYVGGYDDWLRQRPTQKSGEKTTPLIEREVKAASVIDIRNKKKLSYKDQRELDHLPKKIEQLEVEQEQINAQMLLPDFYQQSHNMVDEVNQRLAEVSKVLEKAYARWEELDN